MCALYESCIIIIIIIKTNVYCEWYGLQKMSSEM